MQSDFGGFLKNERELRGISLEEISDITKVRFSFLQAIESNNFDEFPGEVFIKGYIRSYAKAIGSDVDEILNIYDDEIGRDRKEKILAREKKALEASGGDGSLLKFIFSLVLLIAVGTGIYFVFYNFPGGGSIIVESADESVKPSESVEKFPVSPIPQPVDSSVKVEAESLNEKIPAPGNSGEVTGVKPVEAVKQTPSTPTAQAELMVKDEQVKKEATASEESELPPAVGKLHSLEIQTKEKSWFSLTMDNTREEIFTLPAGTQKQFSANDSFKITIGNRAGVVLVLDGKPVTLPEGKQNVVRDFIINPKKEE
jgi:cytoskeleton protein RodZ